MRPRVGIFGLSGCWGEQIVILNCEDDLLDIVGALDIVDFLGGSSVNDETGPLDIALVEGSVSNQRDEEAVRSVRERAKLLVACGSCACFGGIAGMDGDRPWAEVGRLVYGPDAAQFDIRPHRPLRDFVRVDFAIVGCPMEQQEFTRAIASLLNGDLPLAHTTAVCHECRMNELDCVLLSQGLPCTGPVTLGGCGARCPRHGAACIGCRGPVDEANVDSLVSILLAKHPDEHALRRRLRTFAAPVMSGLDTKGAS